MLTLVVVCVSFSFANEVFKAVPLLLSSGAGYLKDFAPAQLQSLGMLALDIQKQGDLFANLFWGLWLLPQLLLNDAWAGLGVAGVAALVATLVASSVVLAFVAASGGGNVPGAAFWHAAFQLGTATAAAGGFLDAFVSAAVLAWAGALVVAEVQARQQGRTVLAPWVEPAGFRFTPSATAP
jgi:hypothetical protein